MCCWRTITEGLGPFTFRDLYIRHRVELCERRREDFQSDGHAMTLFGSEFPEVHDVTDIIEALTEFFE